jgi:rubrerythrin
VRLDPRMIHHGDCLDVMADDNAASRSAPDTVPTHSGTPHSGMDRTLAAVQHGATTDCPAVTAASLSCPKCGRDDAFRSPEYHRRRGSYHITDVRDCEDNSEHLCWPCRVCGYRVQTPPADVVASVEPDS